MSALLLPVAAAPLPHRPDSGLSDEGQVLTPEEADAIQAALAQARRQGLEFFVATFPELEPDISLKEHTEALHATWCQGGYGVVLAMNAATGECRIFSQPPEHDLAFAQTIAELSHEAAAAVKELPTPGARLTGMVEYLAPRLKVQPPPSASFFSSWELQEWLLVVGLSTAGLAFLLVAWHNRRAARSVAAAPPPPLYFPEVTVGTRLGAPFGGGVIARMNFARPLPPRDPSTSPPPPSAPLSFPPSSHPTPKA